MIPPYPLVWPEGLPRTSRPVPGAFKTTLNQAIENVEGSIRRFAADTGQKITDFSFTSNKAGLTNAQPTDRGVSIWFKWDGEQRCIAVDRYEKIEHNVQAIHHIIEARRTELRHGGLAIVRQTFKGFTALPAPKSWQEILGLNRPGLMIDKEAVNRAYRTLAGVAHPDKGGTEAAMAELNQARDRALRELSNLN